jgi:pimeloyl-ACP methyl ester carboxylesterase
MAYVVLVHGAWHGAWCWQRIVPRLQALGHSVTAIDLPGAGDSEIPIGEVTLARYAASVATVLEQLPEPAIVVGHSLGGVTLTQVGEDVPERIRKLVYMAALIPEDGESSIQVLGRLAPDYPRMPVNRILDGAAVELQPDAVADLLYGTCEPADVAWAISHLRPNAVEPMVTPVRRSAARFGRIPRAYIECTRDNAIPLIAQRALGAGQIGTEVARLETDHSPFLCAPDALASLLDRFAA